MTKYKKFQLLKANYLSANKKPKYYIQLNYGKPLHVLNLNVKNNNRTAPNKNYQNGSISKERSTFPQITSSYTPIYWQENQSGSSEKTERGTQETKRRPSPSPSPQASQIPPQTLNQNVQRTPKTVSTATNTSVNNADANTSTTSLNSSGNVNTASTATNTSFANNNNPTLSANVPSPQKTYQDATMASESNFDGTTGVLKQYPK